MIIIYLGIICTTILNNGSIQHSKSYLKWNGECQLAFKDFQGNPNLVGVNASNSGLSRTEILFKGMILNGLPYYKVESYFDRKNSWLKVRDNDLLTHEQGHFNITEIYSRMIRKAIDSLRNIEVRVFKPYLDEIERIRRTEETIQKLYDQETTHGTNSTKQNIWVERNHKELKKLIEFKEDDDFE